ncbi:MAG: hypothetical protein ACRDIE_19460, partial [Chloroflexota bacterium]
TMASTAGFVAATTHGLHAVGQDGFWTAGAGARVEYYPAAKITVIILTNQAAPAWLNTVNATILGPLIFG